MKSTTSNRPCQAQALPFPKLMKSKSDGLIVFFNSRDHGIVVGNPRGRWGVGSYSSSWNTGVFEDYEGSVCLEND